VDVNSVEANNYNPNNMSAVEKRLLARSLELDGFTQPVVVSKQARERFFWCIEQEGYFELQHFHLYRVRNSKSQHSENNC